MAITLQPTDETCSASQAVDGEDTDIALGGFPALAAADVTIAITYQVDGDSSSGGSDSATGTGIIEWSTDGGAGWSSDGTNYRARSQCVGGVGDCAPITKSATLQTASLGRVADLSQIQLRGRATVVLTGSATGSADAAVTDWQISYVPAGRGIMEA